MAKHGIVNSMLVDVAKALADENRLRIIVALEGRELCVCQLTELLGLATSTVSRHVSILRQAGLLSGRKNGTWVFYRLNQKDANAEAKSAIKWVLSGQSALPRAREYQRRLRKIMQINPEELCRRQNRS